MLDLALLHMDGQQWEKPNIMATILKQAPELPHLSSVFFKGAHGTWKRFTTEFTPGGTIDSATDGQKELAWMLATNDINEGCQRLIQMSIRS